MPVRVSDYIEKSNAAQSPREAFDLFRQAVDSFGYENIAFAAVTPAAQQAVRSVLPLPALVVVCAQAWIDHYVGERYQDIDPCLLLAPTRLRPYAWAELVSHKLSPRQRRLFLESREAGLRDGLCIPVHGPGGESYVVSLATATPEPGDAALVGMLQILATQLQLAYTALARNEQPGSGRTHLTDRERECLTWTAKGKSAWAISKILGVSEHTVHFHLKSAIRRIGAGNRVQAVVKAVRLGLISP